MPYKPARPCREQGCNKLAIRGQAYCEEHKRQHDAEYDKYSRDKASTAFYHSAEWIALRKIYREQHPLCEECMKQGRLTSAALVDHIKPIRQGGDKLNIENLQSLCQTCHERKSRAEGSRF